MGRVSTELKNKLSKGRLHFSLLDPDPNKIDLEEVEIRAQQLEEYGTE